MEDFSRDAVIVDANETLLQPGALLSELALMGVALILLTDGGSFPGWEDARIPRVAVLRNRNGGGPSSGVRDALEFLRLHCPQLEYVAVLEARGGSRASEAAGLLSAVHGRKRLMAVETRRPGKGVSLRAWRRNRLSSLLPRLLSGEEEPGVHLGSRAFSAHLIPQFLTVAGDGPAYDGNCLLACIGMGIALEEVAFPRRPEKAVYRPPDFLHSVSPE